MRSPNLKSLLKVVGILFMPISALFFVLFLLGGEFTFALAFGLVCLISLYLMRGSPHLITAVGAFEKPQNARQAMAKIHQETMPHATTAQSKSMSNRRRILYMVFFSWVVCMFGLIAFGRHLFGATLIQWLAKVWWIGLLIYVSTALFIWRCPVCHHALGRGSGKFCKHCKTRFDT